MFSNDLENLFSIKIQCVHVLKNSKIFKSIYVTQGTTLILKLAISLTATKYSANNLWVCSVREGERGDGGTFRQLSIQTTLLHWSCWCNIFWDADSLNIWNLKTHISSLFVLFKTIQQAFIEFLYGQYCIQLGIIRENKKRNRRYSPCLSGQVNNIFKVTKIIQVKTIHNWILNLIQRKKKMSRY